MLDAIDQGTFQRLSRNSTQSLNIGLAMSEKR